MTCGLFFFFFNSLMRLSSTHGCFKWTVCERMATALAPLPFPLLFFLWQLIHRRETLRSRDETSACSTRQPFSPSFGKTPPACVVTSLAELLLGGDSLQKVASEDLKRNHSSVPLDASTFSGIFTSQICGSLPGWQTRGCGQSLLHGWLLWLETL